ncbi:MAG: hypothetical protein H8E09_00610 [Gammaproteobacteria bacterium]|nr:hypothetical protein [Gammaproteobacteria bacterium]
MIDKLKIKNNPESDKKILSKKNICDGDSKRQDAFEHFTVQWINAEDLFQRLLNIFGRFIYLGDKPVVVTLIQESLDTYFNAITRNDRYYYPHEHLHVLLSALMEKVFNYCKFQITRKEGKAVWGIQQTEALNDWQGDVDILQLKNLKISEKEFKAISYDKIVLKNMKQVMKRFNYESSYLASGLGHRS